MLLRHLLPTTSCRKTGTDDCAVLLRNQVGSNFTLYTQRQTRYEGWYLQDKDTFFKLLERIEIVGDSEENPTVQSITRTEKSFFWELLDGTSLGFELTPQHNGLAVAISRPLTLRLIADTRKMYGTPTLGRDYSINPDTEGYLIRYYDETLSSPLYLHLRTQDPLSISKTWKEYIYPRDTLRNSPPDRMYALTIGTITTSTLFLGAGWNPEEAREASAEANRLSPTKPNLGQNPHHNTLLSQTATAKTTVMHGLQMLHTESGIYAGLPWFHQVWSRDELITALGLTKEEQREIIDRYLGLNLENGELPTYGGSHSFCADGVGWLCLLAREYGEYSLPEDTRQRLVRFLTTARDGLRRSRQAGHGLIFSGHNATWMDTIGRSGFRLEIQCMYALLLDLLSSLTEDPHYEQERLQMLGRIRQYFWQDTYLGDGLGDATIRPNIFLAYLLQPDLLHKSQWKLCFETTLAALTCPWGGLSSVTSTNPAFKGKSSGEDNLSYQNGDSWFFINNLAGIALHRLDDSHFGKNIVALLQSSTDEILWSNMIGMPGEISSALKLDSFGCGLQAFSGGTYLALLNQLETYAGQGLDSTAFFWGTSAASS